MTKKFLNLGMLLLLPLWLATPRAAAQRPNPNRAEDKFVPAQGASVGTQKPRPATEDPRYVIGPEDIIDISVWKEPDVSRMVPVRPDGKISLPLLNDIQAAGFTPVQLAALITEQLRKYVNQPQVTVIVTAINSQRVYIMGEVNRPGTIALMPNMTVLQALSVAGGFSQFAGLKKIMVLRNENGKRVTYPFNYKEAIKGRRLEQNIVLKPGDMIVIP